MTIKNFCKKAFSSYVLLHLAGMAALVVLLCVGISIGLKFYTHHGESIKVPNLVNMNYDKALVMLRENGLQIEVSDSGYNKKLPANCILAQSPAAGANVKEGRTIYVTVNSASSPKIALPDLIDNSSYREATARLTAMGFRMQEPKIIDGEKDWVYGIECRGKRVAAGDRVSIEDPLTLVIGGGAYDEDEYEISTLYDDGESGDNEGGTTDDPTVGTIFADEKADE